MLSSELCGRGCAAVHSSRLRAVQQGAQFDSTENTARKRRLEWHDLGNWQNSGSWFSFHCLKGITR